MTTQNQPFYFKFSMILLMLALLCILIFVAQDIIVPLCFAILLSVLLLPVVKFLERKKMGKVPSIMIALFVSLAFISAILYFISTQVINFMDDIPTLKKQLSLHYSTIQTWVRQQFNFTLREQDKLVSNAAEQLKSSGSGYIGQTFFSVTKSLMVLLLLPVYAFLILYYKDMLKKFFIDIFSDKHESKVRDVLNESRSIVQSYMVGLLIEMAIVSTINIGGFLIVGIKYAFFLGVLAAIFNLIPYIGMLIATVFCMIITLTTSQQISDVLWVAAILIVVQFIDNNIIMPKVVSGKVKVNALMSILGVLIGGALAGISGMFLSLPGIALLKVIFERIDELKPWGMLLGDEITGTHQNKYVKRLIQSRQNKTIVKNSTKAGN